jgi:acetoin utilization deacetylase AcuC-like enzyme
MPNIAFERMEKAPGCQFTEGRRAGEGRAIVRAMAGGTAIVIDERMLAHDPGRGHPERPDRLRVLLDTVGEARGLVHLGARPATEDEIARVHTPEHVERTAATAGRARVQIDPDTATSPGSYEAARLAAGSLLVVCDAVLAGEVQNGFALVRPPGHHAEHDRSMGFCLFNNVALAAAALRARGVGRMAIIDWDVHHGNGTQHIFERDPDVLYVSTHQFPFYPGTGDAEEVGRGPGAGRTLNLPFPAGFGDAEYVHAFTELVVPILRQFSPDFVLLSAGFDCDHRDPLGGMLVTSAGFGAMARACLDVAAETADGRLAAVLEGGYDLAAIVEGVDRVLRVMRGAEDTPPPATGRAGNADRVLARVRAAHAAYWRL